MSARARIWVATLAALCLLAGALAAIALAAPTTAPARRTCRAARSSHCRTHVCRSAHAHRCPRSRRARKPLHPGSAEQTRSLPAGSSAPVDPGPSTVPGSPAPSAATAPSEGSTPALGKPAGESPPTSPASPPGPARVQVIAKEYSFTLSRPEVPAGEVILELVNRGEDMHNMHVLEPTEGGEPGALSNTEPGGVRDLKLKLHAGSYTLFCSLPGHEAKGMKATLIVR
jgi:plastocyanin